MKKVTISAKEKLAKVKKALAKVDAEQDELGKIYFPLQERWIKLYDKRDALQERLEKAKIVMMDESKKLDWTLLLHEDGQSGSELYKRSEKLLRKYDMYHMGYYRETEQRVITISMVRGDKKSYARTMAGLKLLLPFLKAHPSDGKIHIHIRERSLSESGSYHLSINPDKKTAAISKNTYGQTTELFAGTLAEAVHTVQNEVWYESRDPRDKARFLGED